MVCKSYSNNAVNKKSVTREAYDDCFPTFKRLPYRTGIMFYGVSSNG